MFPSVGTMIAVGNNTNPEVFGYGLIAGIVLLIGIKIYVRFFA